MRVYQPLPIEAAGQYPESILERISRKSSRNSSASIGINSCKSLAERASSNFRPVNVRSKATGASASRGGRIFPLERVDLFLEPFGRPLGNFRQVLTFYFVRFFKYIISGISETCSLVVYFVVHKQEHRRASPMCSPFGRLGALNFYNKLVTHDFVC
jgi:hypothetical protein